MIWCLAALSLLGVILNIRHDRRCFAIWMVTNGSWAVVDAAHGIWGQAALQAIYFAMSVWGFIRWAHSPIQDTIEE
jgi:hypothetical protein